MHIYAKLLGALLLLVSLAFPMSTCSYYEDADGNRVDVADGEAPPEGMTAVIDNDYAFESFDPLDPGEWVKAFCFAWPILAVAILHLRKRGAVTMAVRILEPALIVGSISLVDFLSTLLADHRALGAYLAFLALGIYAIATIWDDVATFREWKQQRT
jgi:hypothetical protein